MKNEAFVDIATSNVGLIAGLGVALKAVESMGFNVSFWHAAEVLSAAEVAKRKALKRAGEIVANDARALCPVGKRKKGVAKTGENAGEAWTERIPGTLKKSIRSRVTLKGDKVQVIAGGRKSKELTAYYAAMVELRAPFLRPALHKNEKNIELCFNEQMGTAEYYAKEVQNFALEIE